jgi:hypothetical protein
MSVRHFVAPLVVALLLALAAPPALVVAAEFTRQSAGDQAASALFLPGSAEEQRDGTADLRYPPAPTDGYRPRFVRQTGKNCAFASAAMLIDKWTGGQHRPAQERLRRASRVPNSQGVSFAELSRAVARVTGIDLRHSPGGGDPLTWDALLSRLERGGAAVVGGAYSRLPRHYQRWGRGFASLGAAASGHAVYVERYQRTKSGGRVWLMDPLAKAAGYSGEWISVRGLRQYAWRNSKGLVTAAATPEPPPLAGYQFGQPVLEAWAPAGGRTALRLPLSVTRGWPLPKGLAAVVGWRLIEPEPRLTDAASLAQGEAAEGEAVEVGGELAADLMPVRVAVASDPTQPLDEPPDEGDAKGAGVNELVRLKVAGDELVGELDTPEEPGTYEMTIELRTRDGSKLAGGNELVAPLTLRLWGPLAAELELVSVSAPVKGAWLAVDVLVANHGSADWTGSGAAVLHATWHTPLGALPGSQADVELDAGDQLTVTFGTDVPSLADEGELRIELRTRDGQTLAAFGAQSLRVPLRFVEPPGA